VDEDGVALAAIKALQVEVMAKDRQLAELTKRDRRLTALWRADDGRRRSDEARLTLLEQRLDGISARVHGSPLSTPSLVGVRR
jgi:hypothetical protein